MGRRRGGRATIGDVSSTAPIAVPRRRRRTRRGVLALAAAALVVLGLVGCSSSSSQGLKPVELQPLPGGGPVALTSLKGTPLVVNLWATWCAPCKTEMPDLQAASQRAGTSARFIGISNDRDPAAAKKMGNELGVTYDLYSDPQGATQAAYDVTQLPTTLFFDAQGHLVERHTGILDPPTIDALLARIGAHG